MPVSNWCWFDRHTLTLWCSSLEVESWPLQRIRKHERFTEAQASVVVRNLVSVGSSLHAQKRHRSRRPEARHGWRVRRGRGNMLGINGMGGNKNIVVEAALCGNRYICSCYLFIIYWFICWFYWFIFYLKVAILWFCLLLFWLSCVSDCWTHI